MLYTTELVTRTLPVSELFDKYCEPTRILPLCEACPDYGRVWSCPPDGPGTALFRAFKTAVILGVKLGYTEAALARALVSPEETEAVRVESYGFVKRQVIETLLQLEKFFPPSHTIAAGRCELCTRCTRLEGLPCRKPASLRYSFSALGFDLGRVSEELLNTPLLWASRGLPAYQMAIYAFLTDRMEAAEAACENLRTAQETWRREG
ncbi:MAG: DUF2284 domain-containing protein [Bacillota bacterium]